MMKPNFGFHATTKSKSARIAKEGLRAQPFWKTTDFIRRPLKTHWKTPAYATTVSGKTLPQITDAVYEALKSANLHIVLTSRTKFSLGKLCFYLVDLQRAHVKGQKEVRFAVRTKRTSKSRQYGELITELKLESPPEALTEIKLTSEEERQLNQQTAALDWLEANKRIARFIAEKVVMLIKVP